MCEVTRRGANALVTLVRSCYPSACVLFTSTNLNIAYAEGGEMGGLKALQSHVFADKAARLGLPPPPLHGGDRIVARRFVDTSAAASSSARTSSWWAMVCATDSNPADSASCPSMLCSVRKPRAAGRAIPCCPDAILYIDGLELTDVKRVVGPRLIEAIPPMGATQHTTGLASALYRKGRPSPRYIQRRIDWKACWMEKRCAMRGADLLELSLPALCGSARTEDGEARERFLVSVANPGVTLAHLHGQTDATRRGPLRTAFGYSLSCIQTALPGIVIDSVRVIRLWQERVMETEPCTSAFWVSALGHALEGDANDPGSPLRQQVEKIALYPEDGGVSARESSTLRAFFSRLDASGPPQQETLSTSELRQLLVYVLTASILRAASTLPWEEWNAFNYFLPSESFAETTDVHLSRKITRTLTRAEFDQLLHVLRA